MIRILSKTIVWALAALFATAVGAQQLPKSGSISIHTGWRDVGEAKDVAEKRMQGHGSVIGTSFNDKGAGSLHRGPAICFYTFFLADGVVKNKGYCAFGDADGDRIFTDWYGTTPDGNEGINNIAGGTGKYAGIQGSGPWKCGATGASGDQSCTQRFDYRLP
ncbi:MAG: hypothetical protein ABL878_02095 [Burkholderiales bacterium]